MSYVSGLSCHQYRYQCTNSLYVCIRIIGNINYDDIDLAM